MQAAIFEGPGVAPGQYREGSLTTAIERQARRVSSLNYVALALGCVGLAAGLHLAGRKEDSQFVGHWVPTILLLGLYSKLVKLYGSEADPSRP